MSISTDKRRGKPREKPRGEAPRFFPSFPQGKGVVPPPTLLEVLEVTFGRDIVVIPRGFEVMFQPCRGIS